MNNTLLGKVDSSNSFQYEDNVGNSSSNSVPSVPSYEESAKIASQTVLYQDNHVSEDALPPSHSHEGCGQKKD